MSVPRPAMLVARTMSVPRRMLVAMVRPRRHDLRLALVMLGVEDLVRDIGVS
jgi:hypothetical protein